MVVADKLRMDRGIGWWKECLLLWMKYGLDREVGSVRPWKEMLKERNLCDWEEEIESKAA